MLLGYELLGYELLGYELLGYDTPPQVTLEDDGNWPYLRYLPDVQ